MTYENHHSIYAQVLLPVNAVSLKILVFWPNKDFRIAYQHFAHFFTI